MIIHVHTCILHVNKVHAYHGTRACKKSDLMWSDVFSRWQ